MRSSSSLCLLFLLLFVWAAPAVAQEYDSQAGWKVKAPAGWKLATEDGRVLMGSDTEAGLIVVWFEPKAGVAELEQHARAGINEDGVMLSPVGEPKRTKAKAGAAVDVVLSGSDTAGTALKGRAIGVVGGGGAVAILGITTPEQYETIAKRVRQVADGVSFYKPKVGAGAAKLRGTFCQYSSYSSGYASDNSFSSSISRRMTFDGAGRVGWGSQTLVSGTSTSDDSTMTTSGIAGDGSTTEVGAYSVSGNTVNIRWQSGAQSCAVHMRQNDGRITELKCGDQLWAPALCD